MKKKEVIEIIDKVVPSNWLHPSMEDLLRKKDLRKKDYTPKDFENIFMKVKRELKREIREHTSKNKIKKEDKK